MCRAGAEPCLLVRTRVAQVGPSALDVLTFLGALVAAHSSVENGERLRDGQEKVPSLLTHVVVQRNEIITIFESSRVQRENALAFKLCRANALELDAAAQRERAEDVHQLLIVICLFIEELVQPHPCVDVTRAGRQMCPRDHSPARLLLPNADAVWLQLRIGSCLVLLLAPLQLAPRLTSPRRHSGGRLWGAPLGQGRRLRLGHENRRLGHDHGLSRRAEQ
ncbi:hypothetical protein T492DRAFT_946121 [Pavlovales sp. CCMP2436]|nr:hypothetical protein T492DRAFT_946121 [Pavlovales sp. CCMP2436]|mmetsp:Transcript_45036/g.111596  ORF Transcript_45036/g.111596 Transcript_45036/m.111596 type:complete len:221 (-) Transcript_45036:116-778(-)